MHRPLRLLALGLALAGLLGFSLSWRESPALNAEEGKLPFRVPPGFVVEKVAGAPLVEHPIMAGFDDEGRLFVAESAGMNMKGPEILEKRPNSIRVLEDTDGDGRFDKAATFADSFSFPMGALWHDGAFYVMSAPSLWKLEDTTGKRGVAARADRRTEVVAGFKTRGNAADIHGPFLGPDGRFYWTDGGNGHDVRMPDGTAFKGSTARIFRSRPDGSALEMVCAGGFDDPVEMAFTPEGEPFATVDIFINKPARIDAIIYCIEGGAFPWRPEIRKEVKTTGELLPLIADIGWVAPSGLMRYRGDAFGRDFRDNLLVTEFNTHRISRHALERVGAAFVTKAHEFLASTDPDFHPTDVLQDADGSLLVIDTGGWFRNGCPTSQIAKPEIKGAIYRIRRADAPKVDDPRGRKLDWTKLSPAELVGLLDDPRFAVRDRAIHVLGKRGKDAIAVLKEAAARAESAEARRNAVWALTRIETAEAQAALRPAIQDTDMSVRLAATHAAGLLRDGKALSVLMERVRTDHPAMKRQAATALGRLRNAEALPALFEALGKGGDRFLEHALIYALIQIADRPGTLARLKDPNPNIRRGALIALDQMEEGNLTRELVTPLLDTDDRALQQSALAIIAERPGWSGEIVGLLGKWLADPKLDEGRQESLRGALLAFGKDPSIQELVTTALERARTPLPLRMLLLETVA
ncbi:MAG: PVC-type heme-binding CxxCH protein, partial [Gemmataceae bacterium]